MAVQSLFVRHQRSWQASDHMGNEMVCPRAHPSHQYTPNAILEQDLGAMQDQETNKTVSKNAVKNDKPESDVAIFQDGE